jgi:hypothetical protein
MKDYRAKIHFHKQLMTIMDETICEALVRDSTLCYVRRLKPVSVSHETAISIRNKTVLLEPSANLRSTKLVGARWFVTTKESKTIN